MAESYKGRLELNWTNKDLRLLAHDDGSYEWVSPSDYRVAEVRLLRDVETVGDTRLAAERAGDNLLIHGDALNALTALVSLPEFAPEYLGRVRLAYLDPPFNTQQSFLHYDDALEHSVWLTMMRDRLLQIRDLLAPDGSVWVHLDDAEVGYCRVMMDEIYGRENFISSIVWQKAHSRRNDANFISSAHDTILVYAKDKSSLRWNRLEADERTRRLYTNPDNDPRGDWLSVPLHAPNIRPNLTYPVTAPTGREHWPPKGRCWSMERPKVEALLLDGRIYFGADGLGVPRLKRFWDEEDHTLIPWTWWSREETGDNQESRAESRALTGGRDSFVTPKPERLMARIITIATDPGNIVLDPFAGSGTTAAVAHKLGRRWIAIERELDTVRTFIIPRLSNVASGHDKIGVSDVVGWRGGGGFRVMEVGLSMFFVEAGIVVLANWAINGALAEATAAQLGYDYHPDPPFCGLKGRTRLAVIDGIITVGAVRLLVSALHDGENLQVCGTAVEPEARDVLRNLRRGSTLRKIPASILANYRATLTLWDFPEGKEVTSNVTIAE